MEPQAPNRRIVYAALIAKGDSFEVGAVREAAQVVTTAFGYTYDVMRDGRLLVAALLTDDKPVPMRLVVNWQELLKQK